jgi:hypothetical protein
LLGSCACPGGTPGGSGAALSTPSGEGATGCAVLPQISELSRQFHRSYAPTATASIQPATCTHEPRVYVRTQDPFAIMCFYRNKPLRLDCGYGPEPKITSLGATSAALVSVLAASIRAARGDEKH